MGPELQRQRRFECVPSHDGELVRRVAAARRSRVAPEPVDQPEPVQAGLPNHSDLGEIVQRPVTDLLVIGRARQTLSAGLERRTFLPTRSQRGA